METESRRRGPRPNHLLQHGSWFIPIRKPIGSAHDASDTDLGFRD